ncbi:hypothetical protein [Methylophilus sp. 14]|uniref:hypothetical protein n=1 Tax=Methylophilus sp. 14 TaxID=2781019 RepID=UPI00188E7366|nr:hypothetical protein [Methylophilus sp. 14]MBF4987040.1 hypothetical protein [Methylophilus sp. 14]
MKSSFVVVLSVVCAIGLVACEGEPPAEAPAASDQTVAAPATTTAGGYEPAADERVPGITMSQEELDKIYAEARRNMPLPVIPEDAR